MSFPPSLNWGGIYLENFWVWHPHHVSNPILLPDPKDRLDRRWFVVGKNAEGIAAAKEFQVDGIIDDYSRADWAGMPAFKSVDALGGVVINCASSIQPLRIHRRLQGLDGTSVYLYRDIYDPTNGSFHAPEYALTPSRLFECAPLIDWMLSRFNHPLDRETLKGVLNFRLTGDPRHLIDVSKPPREHYVDSLITAWSPEILVDFGGFDGISAVNISRAYPSVKHAIVYEPSAAVSHIAARKLSEELQADSFEIRATAIGPRPGRGRLSDDGHSFATFEYDPEGSIQCDSLSEAAFPEGRVLWKFDIEGLEVETLRSAVSLLASGKYGLAISVYHRATDLFDIVEILRQSGIDWSLAIGHYSEGWSETVLYAAPKV